MVSQDRKCEANIMVVEKTEQTSAERISEIRDTTDKADALVKELAESDFINEVVDSEGEEVKAPLQKQQEEEDAEDGDSEEDGEEKEEEADGEGEEASEEEESNTNEEQEKSETEEEEEMIPKSKFEKRVGSLTARIKALEAEKEVASEQANETKSDLTIKLEKMDKNGIDNLLEDIEFQKTKAVIDEDNARHKELVILKRDVNEFLNTAPAKAKAKAQAIHDKSWAKAVVEIQDDPDLVLSKEDASSLLDIAGKIYGKSASLKASSTGQAESLLMAAEQFKLGKKAPSEKKKTTALKRKNNQLKKKTSLDGKSHKGDIQGNSLKKIKAKAHANGADIFDKLAFFEKKEAGFVDVDALMAK